MPTGILTCGLILDIVLIFGQHVVRTEVKSFSKLVHMLQVVQLLKAGKGKEVSYNALATHIIAEDGDNPEVGESREVFDLPVVKVSIAVHRTAGLYGKKNDCNVCMCIYMFLQFSLLFNYLSPNTTCCTPARYAHLMCPTVNEL